MDKATSEVEVGEVLYAMRLLLSVQLGEMCGGDTSYLDWCQQRFPATHRMLMEILPGTLDRLAQRGVPPRLFQAQVDSALAGHKVIFILWQLDKDGVDIRFAEPPPIPGAGLVH